MQPETQSFLFAHEGMVARVHVSIEWVAAPALSIDDRFVENFWSLSIQGELRDLLGHSAAGQIVPDLLEHFPGDTMRLFCSLWSRWHLNTLRAGTRAQLEALTWLPSKATFRESLEHLRRLGLADRYGSAWLVEPLPEDTARRIFETAAALEREFPAARKERRRAG